MISPEGFRTLRLSCFLSQRTAAELLGVSVRTVRHWDHGRSRVPWSVVRLLRIIRAGELPASGWDGWRVLDGGRLVTPAGEVFRASDFGWWALTVLQARSWQRQFDTDRPVIDGTVLAATFDMGGRLDASADAAGRHGVAEPPATLSADPSRSEPLNGGVLKGGQSSTEGASRSVAPLGLSLIATSGKCVSETASGCGFAQVNESAAGVADAGYAGSLFPCPAPLSHQVGRSP
jgi:hypothetical protein